MYVPSTLPYIFSIMIAAFGLTFKIIIASQFLQFVSPDMNNVRPDYQSIGGFLIDA
jgi:hypothetical protein